ncbi:response regulator transcription factor [Bifidobacterium callimiconis]|uniref:response regulator transcription factor n=1 Tax=Bifidobacterium callimiconis TaxID=2306973 RepID=UPI001BDC4E80|nr:response regulator transcription factor [Bifidobacterium callimiconis]MBT1178037.1 response regulator transcription factor [Bifidobacterium callimiconis]
MRNEERNDMEEHRDPIGVGIVDNDPCALRILAAVVSTIQDCRLLWICDTGTTAIQRCLSRQGRKPDVLIVDMSLDDMSGTTVCETVRKTDPRIAVIAITAYSARRYQTEATKAGACTLITKDRLSTDLPRALREAVNSPSPTPIADHPERLAGQNDQSLAGQQHSDKALSEQERKTLGLYAEGCSTRDIAATMNISESTVYSYQSRAIRKLHARNLLHAIALGTKNGLWSS